jgi:penicillin-binding protein 2
VVTVLVEHGLHGGSASAPIAARILNRYFEDRMKEQQKLWDGEQPGAQLPTGRVVLDGQMIEEADAPEDDADAANGEAGVPPAPQPDESVNGPL